MEWPKLKNIILLILLLLNGFLLVLVGTRYTESVQYERTALELTLARLEARGIRVEADSLSPAGELVPLTLERELERELQMARALLGGGELETENRGGGLYRYWNGRGELAVRAGGELSAAMADSPDWLAADPERHAAGLLGKMGIDAHQLSVVREDGWTRVRFRQHRSGAPLFSCEVEFTYDGGSRLRSVQGTLLSAQDGTAEQARMLTLPTALTRFSEEIAATGDVCSAIRSMEPGWRGTVQPLSGGVRLAPVWLVTTDTAQYYLDCATGALTRI